LAREFDGFHSLSLVVASKRQNYGCRRGKKGYGGKSHLVFVQKRLLHETENKCKSWLPLQDVKVSVRVVRQQIRAENTAGASTTSFVAEEHSHTRVTTGQVKSRTG